MTDKTMRRARLYLVSYDISSPKRWRRVVGVLETIGYRRQLSVFFVATTPARAKRLKRKLERLIDPETDRLMVVDLGFADAAQKQIDGSEVVTPTALVI